MQTTNIAKEATWLLILSVFQTSMLYPRIPTQTKIPVPQGNCFLRVPMFDISADWPKSANFYTHDH